MARLDGVRRMHSSGCGSLTTPGEDKAVYSIAHFFESDVGPRQLVGAVPEWDLLVIDCTGLEDLEVAARVWMDADVEQPVDLLRDKLFSFALIKLERERPFSISAITTSSSTAVVLHSSVSGLQRYTRLWSKGVLRSRRCSVHCAMSGRKASDMSVHRSRRQISNTGPKPNNDTGGEFNSTEN
ncbi:MAG TPA: hypothetical protein VGM27_04510 [Acidobacteriaceae bacterium]